MTPTPTQVEIEALAEREARDLTERAGLDGNTFGDDYDMLVKDIAETLVRFRPLRRGEGAEAVARFAKAILHGDAIHRDWLLRAATAFNAGETMPPPVSAPAAPPAPEVKAEARPKTDREIVDEVNSIARILLGHLSAGYEAPEGHLFYAAKDSRSRKVWQSAVEVYEAITGSEVHDALLCLDDEAPPASSQELRRVRHKKTGGEYEVIGVGKMQSSDWRVLRHQPRISEWETVDMDEVVIYRALKDGSLWVRPVEEFEDGRFETLTKDPS